MLLILLSILSISITPFYLIYKPPATLIRIFHLLWPDVLWTVPTTSKTVALTIDDAPSAYTHDIMQILQANSATATFFVLGAQVPGHERTLQQLVRNGNELANHAMRDEPARALSNATLATQITAVEGLLDAVYAEAERDPPPRYFRPGSGFFSERMRRVVSGLGYRLVLGSIYPHDAQIPYAWINARHILSMLRPGAIIICHDRRSWTLPMLRKVLPEIRRRGYRIVTVTELLKEAKT